MTHVVGSNPSTVYRMDFFHIPIFIVKLQSLFEKTKINEKEAGERIHVRKLSSFLRDLLFDTLLTNQIV